VVGGAGLRAGSGYQFELMIQSAQKHKKYSEIRFLAYFAFFIECNIDPKILIYRSG
jgi:hypothetical protein